jgi:hypothetical protein
VPPDEGVGAGAPKHQDDQPQPAQSPVVADGMHGTRLVETRHAENGVTAFSNMSINALMGGVPSFERELVDGMNATLSRIKAAAES